MLVLLGTSCLKDRLVQCGDQLCPLGARCVAGSCAVGIDAQQFDAPQDAPYRCPQIGTTPQFSPLVHQILVADCTDYSTSTSAGLATGFCPTKKTIGLGPIDQPLASIESLGPTGSSIPAWFPRGIKYLRSPT